MKITLDMDSVNQIVTEDLKGYYDMMKNHPTESNDEVLKAIEVLLTQYMTKEEYNKWYNNTSDNPTNIIRDWEC